MSTLTLVEVDPRKLVVGKNVRAKLGDISALTASIKEKGVLVPLLVSEEAGKYHVIAGGRRTAAAIKAGASLVPCVVTDNGDAQAFLERQLIENLHRQDLTAADEAKGYEQLAAFGMPDADIAAVAGRDLGHVQKALTVARSTIAHGVAAKYDSLTLEQAAAIAEFDDDREAVKELTVRAISEDVASFPHLLAQLRDERDRRAEVAKIRADLAAKGVPETEEHPSYQPEKPPTRISELKDAKGKELTPANHRKCPGHAAYVVDSRYNKPGTIFVCTDPRGNGHKAKFAGAAASGQAGPAKSDAEREKETAARRELLANNKAWKLATPIRLEFVRNLLRRKTAPKGVLRFAVEEAVGDPTSLGGRMGGANERLLVDLLGTRPTKVVGRAHGRLAGLAEAVAAPDPRLPLVLLAQVAADREQFMDHTTWRDGSPASARWLRFLESQGYGLSDVEKIAAARIKP